MQPSHYKLIHNVYARRSTSLNGLWDSIVDPYENGYYDYRYQPLEEPYGVNKKPAKKSDRIEYDFDASPKLIVPGDWNSQRPELGLYEGTIWYKKTFEVDKAPGRRLFLYFGAVNYEAIVYVNGKRLARHVGGFTPFELEVTDDVAQGENVVVVKVDDTRRREGVPTVNTDWWNFGGITRDVLLVDVPQTFIRDYFVQLKPGTDGGEIAGWVKLDGPHGAQQVTLHIPEAGVHETVYTDGAGFAWLSVKAKVERWSDENPRRYEVVIEAESDRVEDRIGFRTIETRGPDILLNGEPVFLRGISIHEQAPLRPGRATSEADARTLLGWAKELGCNFVRLAHYPHNEHMVRVAEELGLLLWAEIPVYWTIQWDNPETYANAERQLLDIITRDKNRAAVILWSVSNETPITDARSTFLRRLIAVARHVDSTRLLTAALERHYRDERTQVVDDPLGKDLDVLGVNEYVGWYDGLPEKCDGLTWDVQYDKPLVISEFGGDAKAGYHADRDTRWSEEFQASVYEHSLAMLRRIPVWRGCSPWILNDFQSPRRPLPGILDFWNRKGLISDRGEKKQAFFVLQAFYRELAARGARGSGAPRK
jgi:beta-glucuronidase